MSVFSIPQLPDTLSQDLDIASVQAARVLLDARYRAVVTFFGRRENTVTALAVQLGVPVANAYYYVKVLEGLNIIKVASSRKRAGKPVKLYACSAHSYFIPNHVAPTEDLRAFLTVAEAPLRDLLERSMAKHLYERRDWGLRFFLDDIGNLHTAFTPQKDWRDWSWLEYDFLPEQTAIFSATVPLSLKKSQAKALQAELGKLFQKYYIDALLDETAAAVEPTYVMRLELAPLPTR